MTMQSKCPIRRAINKLKSFAGMPVPESVLWIGDKPDFRQVDPEKYMHLYKYRLCSVCGTKLKLSCYWVGGQGCVDSHYFADGPMHKECAELSIDLCPFLNKTRPTYRGDDIKPMPVQDASGSRPEKMYLSRGLTDAIEMRQLGKESIALWAGKQLTVVREF
jgi:hypothetical protein